MKDIVSSEISVLEVFLETFGSVSGSASLGSSISLTLNLIFFSNRELRLSSFSSIALLSSTISGDLFILIGSLKTSL